MRRLFLKPKGEQIVVESFALKLGVTRLGRTADNDLQVNQPTISTFHCEIVWMNDSVEVRDRDSTNGTFIEGRRIQKAQLEPGQVLRVGDVEMFLDTAKAAISVPRLTPDTPNIEATPPQGTLPCANHPGIAAFYHCPQCEKDFCDDCVRTLKLLQGHVHKLCPLCSTHCKPIVYQHKRKRRSFLEVVQNAFGLSDKGNTQKM